MSDVKLVKLCDSLYRGRASRWDGVKMQHVAARIYENGVADFNRFGTIESLGWNYDPDCDDNPLCERTIRIRTAGIQVLRQATSGAGNPLRKTEVLSQTPPTVANVTNSPADNGCLFKFEVDVRQQGGFYRFRMDADEEIEIVGEQVVIALLGPTEAEYINVDSFPNEEPGWTGLIVDAVVSTSIQHVESPIGIRECKYTEHYRIPQDESLSITIPKNAVHLQVYQSDDSGAAPVRWDKFIADPNVAGVTGLKTGVIDFTNFASREVDGRLGDATHITTDTDATGDRFVTCIWTIRP